MRLASSLVIFGIVLAASSSMAGEVAPPEPPAAVESPGPVVDGRHRQPTEAEIKAREHAEGESATAIEQRNRQEDQVINDLYKELMKPVPSGSSETGQPAR
jgi:hypothetical protein